MSMNNALEVYRYHLEAGGVFVCPEPAMVSAVLGTCVAVCLHDRRLKIGGMNHFLYPKAKAFTRPTAEYATVSIPALIRMLQKQGSRLEDLEAQIFGGGDNISLVGGGNIGYKNVKIARKLLKKSGVKVVSEDVGGLKGRRLIFHTSTNEALIMKTSRVRRGDYYPYRQRLSS
ncbi:MAG: chemotaxis protein CheD [Candidatus Adiutrix sp.]|jgi:chemotaxis protein CheD|nr:chemotaxis protein CheD [Candidatus Adiutrix sp.]